MVKKTLQVGFFVFLLPNWNGLAKIIYLSFSGLGLKAAGSGNADDLLHPGKIAQLGLDAGKPLLDQASAQMGFTSFFANFVQIAVLMLAWAIVLIAFFIIAIQIFVTLIEFKLVTLAGFVLVPVLLRSRGLPRGRNRRAHAGCRAMCWRCLPAWGSWRWQPR